MLITYMYSMEAVRSTRSFQAIFNIILEVGRSSVKPIYKRCAVQRQSPAPPGWRAEEFFCFQNTFPGFVAFLGGHCCDQTEF